MDFWTPVPVPKVIADVQVLEFTKAEDVDVLRKPARKDDSVAEGHIFYLYVTYSLFYLL